MRLVLGYDVICSFVFAGPMTEMSATMQKKRNAKKKPSTIELPPNVVSQYLRLENFLSHPTKWLSYEWQYDDVEDAYFNKYKTFESMLSLKFPQLKTWNLTGTEWSKIRKMLAGRKVRRFSSKFIHEQRVELEKYRRRYHILRENKRLDQLARLNSAADGLQTLKVEQPKGEICCLIVEAKNIFALKRTTVAELSEINIVRAEAQNSNIEDLHANASAVRAIAKLRECNDEIMNLLNKLLCFQVVKDALLFDALSRKKMILALSPIYFRQKCDVSVYESHQDCRSDTFIESDTVITLMNVLLEQILAFSEYELLAENVMDFANKLVDEQRIILKKTLTTENFEFFETVCLPKFFDIVKKVSISLA